MKTIIKELEWKRPDLGRWCAELHTWDGKHFEAAVMANVELGIFMLSIVIIDDAHSKREVVTFLECESLTIAQANAQSLIVYSLTVRERLLKPEPDRKLS